jgi:hypothetical protein
MYPKTNGHVFVLHNYNLVSSQNTKKNNMSLRVVEALRMDLRFTSVGWMMCSIREKKYPEYGFIHT